MARNAVKRWPSENTLASCEKLYWHFFYQLETIFGRQRAGEIIVRTMLK